MSNPTQRRLAAIVSADVVGYSRLMGVDEVSTLSALRAHRSEVIDPKIAEHGGRIVKTMGDGLLLEFPSVVDAVASAIEVQEAMASRNAGIAEEKRIVCRVGVNLGDIIIEGEDILGDGVNIAARIEALAEPGGIAISGRVHDDVRDRLDVAFTDMGEQTLKNIARPVPVWRRAASVNGGEAEDNAGTIASTSPPVAARPSIAVLPFANMSRDPEHEFFADGVAEDIITALSKIARMRVIARNSTFAYKDHSVDPRQLAGELDVRYVLEGSVRSGGNRLRITALLVDSHDGSHVWAERFDRNVDDIFDIQDEITKEIVTALRVTLTDGEEAHVLSRGTNDIEAWQLCGRATELLLRLNSTDFLDARGLAEQAVKRDPNYAYAWATLGFTYWWEHRLGYREQASEKLAQAAAHAQRARELDDTLGWGIGLDVNIAHSQGRFEEAIALARRGFALHPGSADARAFLGQALIMVGRYSEAIEHFRGAKALNPHPPVYYLAGLGRSLLMLGEFDEALTVMDEGLAKVPTFLVLLIFKICIFHQTERVSEARGIMRELRRDAPDLRLEHLPILTPSTDPKFAELMVKSMRESGLPE